MPTGGDFPGCKPAFQAAFAKWGSGAVAGRQTWSFEHNKKETAFDFTLSKGGTVETDLVKEAST